MRYAIMSDAHANPVALETAIADACEQGCEKLLFLGDATGYGYDAKKTLSIVRRNFSVALMQGIKAAFDPNGILNPGKVASL